MTEERVGVVEIRALAPTDWEAYRAMRLEALELAPEAFGSSFADAVQRPAEEWIGGLQPQPSAFVLGVYSEGRIVGMGGFRRNGGRKETHKGGVWGVYVSPAARGTGAGRRLLQDLIARAREMDGLEQIMLAVVSDNLPARSLYLSLGFVVYGTEPRALQVAGRYLDEDYMVLFL